MPPAPRSQEATCGNSHVLGSRPVGAVSGGDAGAAVPDALKRLQSTEQKALSQHVRTLDQFLTAVSAAMPVDLMPGTDDPCSYLLPQQPFHPCMLPHASRLETLNLCTNPHACQIDGVSFLGPAGQPLDDMLRYETEKECALLCRTAGYTDDWRLMETARQAKFFLSMCVCIQS